MKTNRLLVLIIVMLTCVTETGCKKYLEAKPDKALAVPENLQDLQALLDYWSRVNNQDPAAGVLSVDDFYLTDADYSSLGGDPSQKFYIWSSASLFPPFPNDWSYQYDIVNIANTVLDNIDKVIRKPENAAEWDNVKGQALLLRARSFQLLAWLWANAYDKEKAASDLGIPLRLGSDFNAPSTRPSLQETYDRIIMDFKEAVSRLPVHPVHMFRSSKPAAFALLARTYLSMGDYVNAGNYADSCLRLFSTLLDFNALRAGANYPVARFNAEIIMENRIPAQVMFIGTTAKIDSVLYQYYADDDLRKTIFFKNNNGFYTYKGSYEGGTALFSGVATDEVILTKAECLARLGNTAAAMQELNTLLMKRWNINSFIPFTAVDAKDALDQILKERRKELLMRGFRWMDIKRLNKQGANIVMKRVIGGNTYTLFPNDLRYAFPIPDDIISLTGMPQNPQ